MTLGPWDFGTLEFIHLYIILKIALKVILKVDLDYSVSSGPFLTMNFEFDQDYRPRLGPRLHNLRSSLKFPS